MSFYHNVNPGDPFKPSARLENDIRNLLNGLNGFTGGVNSAIGSKMIRVPVYNTTEDAFEPGQALSLDVSGAIVCDAYPATAFDPEAPCFGVCLNAAPSGQVCDCVICGLAAVEITAGTAGSYVKPISGGSFVRDADEGLKIMNIQGGTNAIIFVGDYHEANETPTPPSSGDVPPGTVIAYAGPLEYLQNGTYEDGNFPEGYEGIGNVPAGWLHCHGQAVSRTVYAALFAAIGTVYGEGDGETTFNIPDYRGSFLRGSGTPNPHSVNAHIVYEEVEGETPADLGYIDVTNEYADGGSFSYNGETIELDSSAVFTPNGVSMNGVLYSYSDMENLTDIYLGGGTVTAFSPIVMEGGEGQDQMGVQLQQELPNISGKFMALTQDKYFPSEKYDGAFSIHAMDGRNVLTEFKRTHYNYPSYITVKCVDTDGNNSKIFNEVEIYWDPPREYDPEIDGSGSGNVQDNPYANKFPALVVVNYSWYMGQRITGCGNAFTVHDYIEQYNDTPPENLLTVKNNTTSGNNLPTRHIVHWLIKY